MRLNEKQSRVVVPQDAMFSLESMHSFIGQELGVSNWVRLDQARIAEFAHCTGDDQWIHVDEERSARESPFRSTIAHGYLTLSLVGTAALEVWIRPAGILSVLNYGIDRVRFLRPVPSGRRVRSRVKLLAIEPKSSGRILITTENTVEIEGGDKPALIANTLVMAMQGGYGGA
jgi:acyl dehydratase